ncbi:MAG: DEAD/DEAH box helicase [Spirochaetales bacterium]|nr:DEAD/DEAH box helicase [Spirochaetales bacterium]
MEFSDFGLSDALLRAVDELEFKEPTPIQEKVIYNLLNDERDIVGLAQTGTGKTAAFGLPLIERTDAKDKSVQSLVLCPTRELCLQITRDMKDFARYVDNVRITPVYGGASIVQQIRDLKRGTQIIVATPGRLLDLIRRNAADVGVISHLILDEADLMLNMGFKDELDAILEALPEERRTVLLSATMPYEVEKIAFKYMKEPVELVAGERNVGIDTVEHGYFIVHSRDKYLALKRIVDYNPDIYGIIFCRTRISTQEIADKMIKDGYNAEALHGDLTQAQREHVMRKFREHDLQLLVATDIAARGLDVSDLTHIIHYDLPDELEIYTHRSGRTGRAGKTGTSLAIVNLREKSKLKRIERSVKRKIEEKNVPTGREICEKQLIDFMNRVKSVDVDTESIESFMPVIEEKFASLSREEILKRFVSLEFNRFLSYYKNTRDLSPVVRGGMEMESGRRRRKKHKFSGERSAKSQLRGQFKGYAKGQKFNRASGFSYLKVNMGKHDKMLPPQIIGLVNESTRNRNIKLGKIEIRADEARFQVENNHIEEVYRALNGYYYRGKKLHVTRIKK